MSKIKQTFTKPPKYKQELLILLALKEKGFDMNKIEIRCDHILGINYVNEIKLGIKYPENFFYLSEDLISTSKKHCFYFNGNMDEDGQRRIMLQPFMERSDSLIIASNDGRIQHAKDKFNTEYFSEFARSKFGLCPHQANWLGDREYMWTYRFIEACFVEAIPVLFEEAPLGERFTNGFYFLWSSDFNDNCVIEYKPILARKNRELAKQRFCLTEEECFMISNTLK